MAAQRRPPVQTLARFPKPLTLHGITCDCLRNIIVAVSAEHPAESWELLHDPADGSLPQRLLTHEDEIFGVRGIAVSPDGKELYVLGEDQGNVSQYLFPWGLQPAHLVLTNLDLRPYNPEVKHIFCDRPG
jgi:hypothetical protein